MISQIHLDDVGDRVLRGDPLARDAVPATKASNARQRGGCMLLFRPNFGCLAVPQRGRRLVGARVGTRTV